MKPAAKKKTAYFCTQCGAMHLRWQGQCKECGAWNSLNEETIVSSKSPSKSPSTAIEAVSISEISSDDQARIVSGMDEFDRVLGNGAVAGSAILIGGEPGIGKSSLLLQVAEMYGRAGQQVLYISGEESANQIKSRANRFGLSGENISVANVTELENIIGLAGEGFEVIIIDSIQTIASSTFDSPPGTVGQVRECSARLIEQTKKNDKVLFLVGHITKEGMVAGPKVLEHMVDTVLYFEGDRYHLYRILRSQKNRFGPAGEIGVFEMTGEGLKEIKNPSQVFMSSAGGELSPGRVISSAVEGSRSFLVEVEALVATSPYGTPQRVASGIDSRRLAILNAVLEKRGGVMLGGNDVFVNIAGGIHLDDTALDLAFLMAIGSSRLNVALETDTIVMGEVGLSGDVRGVTQIERRLTEAARLGLKKAIIPRSSAIEMKKIEVIPVAGIDQALQLIR